ncbi:hypothetical protein SDC9_184469 [bioreactor metagenome]|uniref:Uncharacterized protein n=1 Tax=bioreactor metagenome TaxID=1076179 RepID=A0A645HD53_9ZZZZ
MAGHILGIAIEFILNKNDFIADISKIDCGHAQDSAYHIHRHGGNRNIDGQAGQLCNCVDIRSRHYISDFF